MAIPVGIKALSPGKSVRGSSMQAARSSPAAPSVAYLGRGTVRPISGDTGFTFTSIFTSSILSNAHLVQRPMQLVLSQRADSRDDEVVAEKLPRRPGGRRQGSPLSIVSISWSGVRSSSSKSSARAIRLIRLAVFSRPSMRLPLSCSLARCNSAGSSPSRGHPGPARRG